MYRGLASLWVMLCVSAASASVVFTKVVDTETLVPGTNETFSGFDCNIALEGDKIAFAGGWGPEGEEQLGLFARNGTLETIVGANTPIPEGEGDFTLCGLPALAGGKLAFVGIQLDEGYIPTWSGIYHVVDGGLAKITDQDTPIPGGVGNFTFLNNVARSEGVVAFEARDTVSDQRGVYAWSDGELSLVVDRNTTIPGTTVSFDSFSTPAVDEDEVIFRGMYQVGPGDAWDGIYGTAPDLHVIIDENTPVPGGTATFEEFSYVSASNGAIAFVGSDRWWQPSRGLYTTLGDLRAVAERDWPIPGGTTTFRSFIRPVIDGEVIVFQASTDEAVGIYAEVRGTLVKLIDDSDMLDGKAIRSLRIGPNALDGNRVAIRVEYLDGSQAVYVATICLGDLDGDGLVGVQDLIRLLSNYGSSGVLIEDGDINGDGIVDISDLGILLSNYESRCL